MHSGSIKLQVRSFLFVLVANTSAYVKNLIAVLLPQLSIRKDGSSFRDLLHVSPIRDASGKVRLHLSQVFPERSCFSYELNNYYTIAMFLEGSVFFYSCPM